MTAYQTIAILLCITAMFAYINHRWIKWPATIGIMVLSMLFSILIVAYGQLAPQWSEGMVKLVSEINFEQVLMKIMLSFLLFAGAIHIDAGKLKQQRWPVLILATVGVGISAFLVSVMSYGVFNLFAVPMPYIYCLLFGALMSPTDPISVLGILKRVGIPKSLELKIAGESLFNDGVGVVVFLTILEMAANGIENTSAHSVLMLLLREAGGGIAFGLLSGYLVYGLIKSIDNYNVELLIMLALVTGGYLLADGLHVSAPLAIIVAGIIVGNKSKQGALSSESNDYIWKFWELMDEIFNAILFLLMGLGMMVIKISPVIVLIGLVMIVAVLLARYLSVLIPVALLRFKIKFEPYAVTILTWGGLRGGLSVAMALSLPAAMHRDTFVQITYIIVVFSVVIQGLTIGKLTARLQQRAAP